MISVVLATFNSSNYITQQLNSIINQEKQIDEMIIVDDCSSDDTISIINRIIKKYNLRNWYIFKNKKNLGYKQTFQRAISMAHGDIIILCDHDDIWMKNKVSLIDKSFKDNKNILYLATSYVQIDSKNITKKIRLKKNRANNNLIKHSVIPHELNKLNFKDIATYNIAPGCTCAFSRKILPDFLAFKNCLLPHDWELATISAVKNGLYYLDIPTTKYRVYDGNTIGLGHQSNYKKRVNLCQQNMEEKEEMLLLVRKIDASKNDIKYLKRVTSIFKQRYKNIKDRNVVLDIILVLKTYGIYALYESILMDIFTMLKVRG